MRPYVPRRMGIAAVVGGLLLASGTAPIFGGDASSAPKAEGTDQIDATQAAAPCAIVDWLQRAGRAVVRALERGSEALAKRVSPAPKPVAPVAIVDDGAPF